MTISLDTTIRRIGLLVVALMGLAAVLSGAALAGSRPAASFYTPQQLEAMSQSWAARGGVFVNRPAASYYTPQQLEAMSQSWAARGRHAAGLRSAVDSRSGFDWGDFGIGAAAMLGAVLLVGGVAGAARYSRRGGVRARTAS